MNWRVTAVLFVLVVLVGGYAYYDSQDTTPGPTPTPAAPAVERIPLLPGVAIDDVTELAVSSAPGVVTDTLRTEATYFRDATGSWLQVVPTRTVAVSATLDGAVTGLLNLNSRRSLEAPEGGLAPFGLERPSYELRLTYLADGSPRSDRFLVGGQTPAGDAYYIQRAGDERIHLVAPFSIDALLDLLAAPPLPLPTPTPITIEINPPPTDTVPITDTLPLTTTVPITE